MSEGARFCPRCGKPVDQDVRFCPSCGASLLVQPPPAPADPSPPTDQPPYQPAPLSYSSGLGFLKVAEDLLRRRRDVFANIKSGQGLNRFLLNANLAILLFAAIYGATMGAYPGGLQILYSIVKIPLLLVITMYVALPTYYVLDAFSGGDVSLRQIAAVIVSSFAIMSIVLLAFVPVSLFFILTTPGQGFSTYAFIVLLNVGIFTIAGVAGLVYQFSGMGHIHSSTRWGSAFVIGLLVEMFVGTQMAWVLRPYFDTGPFVRPLEGNFYIALIKLIARALGG